MWLGVMDRIQAFGLALREARLRAGLSQEALAERADLHRNWVSLVERGKHAAALDSIFALADALELNAAHLIEQAEQRASEDNQQQMRRVTRRPR